MIGPTQMLKYIFSFLSNLILSVLNTFVVRSFVRCPEKNKNVQNITFKNLKGKENHVKYDAIFEKYYQKESNSEVPAIEKINWLNKCKKKKTLILDLDETLIHSSLSKYSNVHPDFELAIEINGKESVFNVHKRPHVDYFLHTVSSLEKKNNSSSKRNS